MASLEAILPTYKTPEELNRMFLEMKTLFGSLVPPILIVSATGAAEDLQFNLTKSAVIVLQNCSTNNVKWAIGQDAETGLFHGILAPCSSTDAGNGGILTIPGIINKRISLFSDGSSKRIATYIMYFN